MSEINLPNPYLPWIAPNHMDNLKIHIDLIGQNMDKFRVGHTKHHDAIKTITDSYAQIVEINRICATKGRYEMNPDGSPKMDSNTGSMKIIAEVNNGQVSKLLNEIKDSANFIMNHSEKRFKQDNDAGGIVLNMVNLCNSFIVFDNKTRVDTERNYLKPFYEENYSKLTNPVVIDEAKQRWTDANDMAKLQEAVVKMQTLLGADAVKELNENVIALNKIDDFTTKNGPYKHNSDGSLEVKKGIVQMADEIDDPIISTCVNNIRTQAKLLQSKLQTGSPEHKLMQELQETMIFEKNRDKKQALETNYLRVVYIDVTHKVNNTSTLTVDSAVIPSSREPGFLKTDKIDKIKTTLSQSGWSVGEPSKQGAIREVVSTSNGTEKKFTIATDKLETKTADKDTFVAMLKTFQATTAKPPKVETHSEEARQKWIEAYKEVYPESKLDFDKNFTVKAQPIKSPTKAADLASVNDSTADQKNASRFTR
jgi:hypothetical protein